MDINLQQALREGILTEEQVTQLQDMQSRSQSPAERGDERIGLIKGYNDIFISLALILLGVGVYALSPDDYEGISLAIVGWCSAEILRVKYRSILPMIISTLYIAFIATAIPWVELENYKDMTGWNLVLNSLIALGVLSIAYWRFKLPFTLALISLNLIIAAFILMMTILYDVMGIKIDDLSLIIQIFSFISGSIVFALAMRYDMSDPERQTRRSDCAFWLHIIASALVIHGALGQVFVQDGEVIISAALISLFFVFIIALLINRKSLIVASLVYAASAVYYMFENSMFGI